MTGPVFLVQGVYCNRLGQPTVVEWMAISGLPGTPSIIAMDQALTDAEVGPGLVNRAETIALAELQALVPAAVRAAGEHLAARRDEWAARIAAPLDDHRAHLTRFEQLSLADAGDAAGRSPERGPDRGQRSRGRIRATVQEQRDLVDRLETDGDPMLRVLAVLVESPEDAA